MRTMGLFLVLAMVGCGEDALDEAGDVRTWVNAGSALAVYSRIHEVESFTDGRTTTFPDPTCPMTTDDGTMVTITGGCTDSGDVEWAGTATAMRGTDGSRMLHFEHFAKVNDPSLRVTISGDAMITEMSATMHGFDVDMVQEGGLTTTIHYQGTVEGGYDGPTTWNGSGTVDRDGLVNPTGTAQVSTVDEVWDGDVCSGAPVSGTTTVVADDHTAVVTYDGATDCDMDKAVEWTLDGAPQGKVTGITCAAAAPGAGGGSPAAVLGMMLLGVAVRSAARRRRALRR